MKPTHHYVHGAPVKLADPLPLAAVRRVLKLLEG